MRRRRQCSPMFNMCLAAQGRLSHLQDELAATEDQITKATHELQSLMESQPSKHLTEDDKQEIRNRLARKANKVKPRAHPEIHEWMNGPPVTGHGFAFAPFSILRFMNEWMDLLSQGAGSLLPHSAAFFLAGERIERRRRWNRVRNAANTTRNRTPGEGNRTTSRPASPCREWRISLREDNLFLLFCSSFFLSFGFLLLTTTGFWIALCRTTYMYEWLALLSL